MRPKFGIHPRVHLWVWPFSQTFIEGHPRELDLLDPTLTSLAVNV